jgi:hypothetical protein
MTNYTADQLATFPWIVSTGTLRPCDLAAAYLATIDQLGGTVGEFERAELAQLANHTSDAVGPEPTDSAWWALSEAESLLSELAPTGFFFGANEGDSACFGFWITEDWAEHLEQMGMGSDDPIGWAALIQELEDGGVDSDNFEDCYQGRAEGYSEERAGADYAQELAEATGTIDWSKLQWPLTCIDWEQAWQELRMGDGFWLQDIGGGDWLVFRNA